RLDSGDDLDDAAAGSDDGNALAGEVDIVAPLSGMERRTFECRHAPDLWQLRYRQLSAGGDQHVGLMIASARLDQPAATSVVPAGAQHLGAGADAVQDAVAAGDFFHIRLDLRLGRVAAGPLGVGCERKLIEM